MDMRVRVRELGHVSLFVRDLDATRRFYRDVLGLTETGTGKNGRIVFFAITDGKHHHDVSCELSRAEGPGPQPKGIPGLYHIAFAVDDVAAARRWVESHGLTPFGEYDRGFCVRDPDGHEIELYTDVRGSAAAPPERSIKAGAGEAGARATLTESDGRA